jgi:hypothetical protein
MTMGIDDERAAVDSLVPNNKSHIKNGVIVTWDSEETEPTQSEINDEMIRLGEAYSDNEYARNRAAEYPSQGDQNDMIYKDMLNSTTTHKDAVEAVKTKWPKNNKGPIE